MSTVTAVPIAPVKRGYLVWLWLGIAAIIVLAAALAWMGRPGILRVETLVAGKGPSPTDSDVALVNYVGRLTNGSVFDQSHQPTPMPVSGVVPGFSQGLKQMQKGGKYRLTIPPQLGYGNKSNGPIPANSTLVFEVELIDFLPEAQVRAMQQQQMMQQQMMQQMPQGQGGAPGVPSPPPAGR